MAKRNAAKLHCEQNQILPRERFNLLEMIHFMKNLSPNIHLPLECYRQKVCKISLSGIAQFHANADRTKDVWGQVFHKCHRKNKSSLIFLITNHE